MTVHTCNPSTEVETGRSLGLSGQPAGLLGKFCLKKQGRRAPKEWQLRLTSGHDPQEHTQIFNKGTKDKKEVMYLLGCSTATFIYFYYSYLFLKF